MLGRGWEWEGMFKIINPFCTLLADLILHCKLNVHTVCPYAKQTNKKKKFTLKAILSNSGCLKSPMYKHAPKKQVER